MNESNNLIFFDEYSLIEAAKRQKSDATFFCFILFTRRNSDVIKVLNDKDRINELDELSNEYLNIFAIKPFSEQNTQNNNYNNGIIQFISIEKVVKQTNYKLLNLFNLNDVDDLPLLYFLDKNSSNGYGIKIKGKNENDVFNSIKSTIETCISLHRKEKFSLEDITKKFAINDTMFKIVDITKKLKEFLSFF